MKLTSSLEHRFPIQCERTSFPASFASSAGRKNISVGFRLSRVGAFYLSIGTIGTIGTNGIAFISVAFHWWNASRYGDLEYFHWLQAEWGCILLVHWYYWYQQGTIYYIWYILLSLCLGSKNIHRIKCFWACTLYKCSLEMVYRSTVYLSTCTFGTNGTNRQVVHGRLLSVNICSLQMEHQSAASFSIGTIVSNSTSRQI